MIIDNEAVGSIDDVIETYFNKSGLMLSPSQAIKMMYSAFKRLEGDEEQ